MPKRRLAHPAFTLIEVIAAVMIVSVVIAALLQMQGNTSKKLFEIKKIAEQSQYSSFFIFNRDKYGFESTTTDMGTLLDDFELESELRRSLSSIKVSIDYNELTLIDTNEMFEGDSKNLDATVGSSGVIFEIGKTELNTEKFSNQIIRVRVQ